MTAAGTHREALANLTEVSREIEGAVVVDEAGTLLHAAGLDEERAARVAATGSALLRAADERSGGRAPLTHLTAEILGGAVFVVRSGDRAIVAVTGAEPTTGLVFYDLKVTLRDLVEPAPAESEERPKRAPRKRSRAKPKEEAADA